MRNWLSGWSKLALFTCVRCALCARECRPYEVSGAKDALPSRKAQLVLSASRAGLAAPAPVFEYCTLCGACQFTCPFGIQTVSAWLEAREAAYKAEATPPAVRGLAERVRAAGNPYGVDNEMRAEWTEFYGIDVKTGAKAKVIYFAGCTSSFKSACQSIAASFANLLNAAGTNWALLGDSEVCCGAPSLMAGDTESVEEVAEKNLEAIKAAGADVVVTTCPACYRMLKWAYPRILTAPLSFRVLHAVEYMAELVRNGRLTLSKLNTPVTYHDPCELTRLSGLSAEPRFLISGVASLREMTRTGVNAACCGGGGLLTASNPELRLRIAESRVEEAQRTGAESLVSACPSCKLTLSDGAKALKSKLRVIDIAEFVAETAGVSL